jgi:predicted NBD/HSP70 family sugar kinase
MVTGPGILRRAAEAGVRMDDPAELFADSATDQLRSLRAQFDQALLIVLAAVIVACEPQCIILGGGVVRSLETSFPRYQESLRGALGFAPPLIPAALGDFAGAAGAVAAGLKQSYRALGVRDADLPKLPSAGALTPEAVAAERGRMAL